MPRSPGAGPGYRLAHAVDPTLGPATVLPRYETWPIPITRSPDHTTQAEATCGTCGLTLRYRLLSAGPTIALRVLWALLFLGFTVFFAVTMYYFLMGPADDANRPHSALLFLGTLAAPAIAYFTGHQFRHETGLFGPGRWIGYRGHALTPAPASTESFFR